MTTITSVQCLTKYLGLHAALIQGQYLLANTVSGIRSRYLKKKIAGSNSTHSPSPFPFQHILTPHIGLTIDWNYYNNLAN